MLHYALVLAGTAMWIAKVLFVVFLILAIVSFVKKSA